MNAMEINGRMAEYNSFERKLKKMLAF